MNQPYKLYLTLDGFTPLGEISPEDPMQRSVSISWTSLDDPVEPTGMVDTLTGRLTMNVIALRDDFDQEMVICCYRLPLSSVQNNPNFKIGLTQTSIVDTIPWVATIPEQEVKNSPEVFRGNYWEHLQLMFYPPVSLSDVIIHMIVQPAQTLSDGINQTFFLTANTLFLQSFVIFYLLRFGF